MDIEKLREELIADEGMRLDVYTDARLGITRLSA